MQAALVEHKQTGERLGAVLVRMGFASEKQVTKALTYQLGFPYASLADEPPDPAAIVLIPKKVALKRVCVAVRLEKNLLTVAMSDPLLFSLVQDSRRVTASGRSSRPARKFFRRLKLDIPTRRSRGTPNVFLTGSGLAPTPELAGRIAECRRKSRGRIPVLVPMDVRDWDALVPTEAPAAIRAIIEKLKKPL